MGATGFNSSSGRAAAVARRRALSAGKAALPPATERVRTGTHDAAVPGPAVYAPAPSGPAGAPSASTSTAAAAKTVSPALAGESGRSVSMRRRRQISGGKGALSIAPAAPPAAATARAPLDSGPVARPGASGVAAPHGGCGSSCREQARARRAALSQHGRGERAAAPPSRAPRQGALNYVPKVGESKTHGGQIVTGSRMGRGVRVTGTEPGAQLPVSGTQYIEANAGTPLRAGGPKVGFSCTAGGTVVSGTLVRSQVRVTGDESGGGIVITGEAEQNPADDVTPRTRDAAPVEAQFARQVALHGNGAFGGNVGRFAHTPGSRTRARATTIESTEDGLPITGSAVGRSARVTGDENGSCRQVTGDQILTPARAQAECGGAGGGTGSTAHAGSARRDAVTGGKVGEAVTWRGQRVTGTRVEHDPRVTGDAAGTCALVSGTPYQGSGPVREWCDPAIADTAQERLPRRAPRAVVSGDVPAHSDKVTGTHRGAVRDVTGTAYGQAPIEAAANAPSDPLAALAARFSVACPQRNAQLRARAEREARTGARPEDMAGRAAVGDSAAISGSFAIGRERVTGNAEFHFRPRVPSTPPVAAAHLRLTGEGSEQGARITGRSWSETGRVTGTEGAVAAARNPSLRAGEPQAFSGARHFKSAAKNRPAETKQTVTGLLGWSGKTAARVTLSGGAPA